MAFDMKTVAVMAFNFFSSIGIIFINKMVFKTLGFKFGTFYTSLHFMGTCVGLMICRMCGMYQVKKLSHAQVFPISLAFCIHIVFNNLSLQYNSVGFYQLMKVLMSPITAFIQTVWFGVPIHTSLQIALFITCCGVGLATVNDVNVNFTGTVFAVLGLLGGVFYQLWVKTKQKALNASSFQVLTYQAPQSAVIVLCITPLFDELHGPRGLLRALQDMDVQLAIALTLACSIAFCVNLSLFLVIGRTSPLSYQVLGHFKLVVVLLGGIFLFGGDTNPKRLLGMLVTFIGVVVYGHLKMNQTQTAENWDKKNGAQVAPSSDDKDEKLGLVLAKPEQAR
jgi:solute carrier family 35 protein E3